MFILFMLFIFFCFLSFCYDVLLCVVDVLYIYVVWSGYHFAVDNAQRSISFQNIKHFEQFSNFSYIGSNFGLRCLI